MTTSGVASFPRPPAAAHAADASAVICGSYRRDPEGLAHAYAALTEAGCKVLSPSGVEFTDEVNGFVLTEDERGLDPADVEARHLRAMREADFVWLIAPDGYVGPSAGLELGYAQALGLRVFGSTLPCEAVYAPMVELVPSIAAALDTLGDLRASRAPVGSLGALQVYYRRAATARGYADESPRDCLLLLTEEVGELARAVRKTAGLVRDHTYRDGESAATEIADVQLYLVHLANLLDVDMADAVAKKERVNTERYLSRLAEAA